MFRRTRSRHHVVVAYLALFVALGGTAIAAKPKITGEDIEDDTVTAADVLESSLGTVPSAAAAGVRGHEIVGATDTAEVGGPADAMATATCPAGKVAVGGGYGLDAPRDVKVVLSVPESNLAGERSWVVRATSDSFHAVEEEWTLRMYAICVEGT